MKPNSVIPTKLAAVLASLLLIQSAFAQGTAFLYQGRLDNNGSPANANVDLRFTLHDSASGGNQMGSALIRAPLAISNGLFTVTLDFGNQFPGAGRWLEIGVRTNGDTTPYTILAPRQALASTPYAVQALNAANAATASSVAAGSVTGTLPDARLSSNVALRSGGNTFNGDQIVGSGRVGIGTSNPRAALHSTGTYYGWGDFRLYSFLGDGSNGTAFVQARDDSGSSSIGMQLRTQNSGSLVEAIRMTPSGDVGIGTVTPASKLQVNGTVTATGFSGNAAGLTNVSFDSLVGSLRNNSNGMAMVNHLDVGATPRDIEIRNGFLFLAAGSAGVQCFSLSNPDSPQYLSGTGPLNAASEIAFLNESNLVVAGGNTLRIYNWANPAVNPTLLSTISVAGDIVGLAINSNFVYLAEFQTGLRVYNVANPSSPSLSSFVVRGNLYQLKVYQNHLYVGSLYAGNGEVFSLSNPGTPASVGTFPYSEILEVDASRGLLYVGHIYGAGPFAVYSLANPVAPALLNTTPFGAAYQYRFAFSGNLVYIPAATNVYSPRFANYLECYDVSTPPLPVLVERISVGLHGVVGIGVYSDRTYVGNGNHLNVYKRGTAESSIAVRAAAVQADYLAGNGGGLENLNASELASGTLADARLSTNVALRSGGNDFSGNQTLLNGNLRVPVNGGILVQSGSGSYVNAFIPRWGDEVTYLYHATNGLHLYSHTGNSTMRILGNGNVGIGTISPSAPLSFANALGEKLCFWDTGGSRYGMGLQGNLLQVYADASSSDIAFGYGSSASFTERMRIKGTGNVGIGSANPQRLLQIGDTSQPGSEGMIRLVSVAAAGSAQIAWDIGAPQTGNSAVGVGYSLIIDQPAIGGQPEFLIRWDTGYVGIGVTNPASKLHVNGTVTATAFNPPSDRNLKQNFEAVNPREVLDKVMTLPITRWNFKEDAATPHVGPMAQDFYAAFGLGTDERHIATVDADGVALAAIQGLNQKLEAQKAENTELKARLEKLERLLEHKLNGGVK